MELEDGVRGAWEDEDGALDTGSDAELDTGNGGSKRRDRR